MSAVRLIQAGVLLFLLGLFSGLATPAMASPRLGLSSHLEGVMNGMFLILMGLVWPKLALSPPVKRATGGALLFGTYVNWLTVLMAGIWGAGSQMMPIAGGSAVGSPIQEGLVKAGLGSLTIAMIAGCVGVLVGLRATGDDQG